MTGLPRDMLGGDLFHVEQVQMPDPFHVKRHQEELR